MDDIINSKFELSEYYETRRLQEELLEILVDIDSFCRSNDIKYSLSGGTLLGAVRHKGFIPWDDDADIMFEREYYKEFIKEFENEYSNKYQLCDNQWVKSIRKKDSSENIGVDIFIIDAVPNNKVIAYIKVLTIKILQGMMKENININNYRLRYRCPLYLTRIVGKLFSTRTKLEMYTNVSMWSNKKIDSHENCNVYNTYFNQIGRTNYKKESVSKYKNIDFCNKNFMSIIGYDAYLQMIYGDYMMLPKIEERKCKH